MTSDDYEAESYRIGEFMFAEMLCSGKLSRWRLRKAPGQDHRSVSSDLLRPRQCTMRQKYTDRK